MTTTTTTTTTIEHTPLRVRRWLVAHDFSASADAAARMAASDLIDGGVDGCIVLLHIYQVMPLPSPFDTGGAGLVAMDEALSSESAVRLERLADALRKDVALMRAERQSAPTVQVETVVRQDGPCEGILAEAKERDVERIAMGSRGHTGLMHFLLGSTAERVVRLANVPVLVVKGPA